MRSFARLGVIGGAVVALGLAAEAFAETAETKVLGVDCPPALKDSLDAALKDTPAIVLVVQHGRPDALLAACVTGGLEATPCDKADCKLEGPPKGTAFFWSSSPDTVCWNPPTGGTGGCDGVNFP